MYRQIDVDHESGLNVLLRVMSEACDYFFSRYIACLFLHIKGVWMDIKVAKIISTKQLIINAGKDQKIKLGQRFEIKGQEIKIWYVFNPS